MTNIVEFLHRNEAAAIVLHKEERADYTIEYDKIMQIAKARQ